MPTDRQALAANRALASRRILRLALGTAMAMWISQVGAWPLSFIAPVLTLTLLALPLSRPGAKFFVGTIIALLVSVYGSYLLLPLLLNQVLAGLVLLSLVLFHIFYFTARGGPVAIGTLLTIGVTLTVAVGSVSVDALILVSAGVAKAAFLGVGMAWLSHVLLPDPVEPVLAVAATDKKPDKQPEKPPARPSAAEARRNAMRAIAVVLPITVWFLFSPASATNAAVMIKVAAMVQESSRDRVKDAARSLLTSTAAGGAAAILAWQLLGIWPSLMLYALLIGLAGLVFGRRIFIGRGLADDGATWSYAFLTMMVVLGPAVLDSQFGGSASAAFYGRLWMFIGASLYGVGAVYVFEAFWPATQRFPMMRTSQISEKPII